MYDLLYPLSAPRGRGMTSKTHCHAERSGDDHEGFVIVIAQSKHPYPQHVTAG